MNEALKLALVIEEFDKNDESLPLELLKPISAKLRSIAELESQEPVAYINVEKRTLEWAKLTSWETPTVVNLPKISLYTHPPQRTWVDLTEVQIQNVYFEVLKEHRGAPMPWGQVQFGKAVLEKFKEKNT